MGTVVRPGGPNGEVPRPLRSFVSGTAWMPRIWYTNAVMAEIPHIDGFTFRQRLTASSRSELWRAEQTALERDVLVTVFGPGAQLGAVQVLAQTKSPLIPEIIDIQQSEDRTCVITEDPHARGIVALLAGRRLDAGQISNLGMRLAEGFALKDYEAKCGSSFLADFGASFKELSAEGLLACDGTNVKPTEQGMNLLDRVLLRLYNDLR